MEDFDTTTDFSNHNDDELMLNEVIKEDSDLYFIHCCLGETLRNDDMNDA